MLVTVNIKDASRMPAFMEMLADIDYVEVLKSQVAQRSARRTERKRERLQALTRAFDEVNLYEQGKIKLKTAQEILNEI